MKTIATTFLVVLFLSPSVAFSQTRSRSSRQKPTSATANKERVAQARTAGATRVAEQIKLLSRFTYLLGGIANGIASVDEAIRRNEAPPALLQQNQQRKTTVRSSIQDFRVGLDKLETDFRATPELQPYYIKLAGSAAGAAAAEEAAAANQFDRAGKTLLDVITRLTDVLLLMRTTE